MEYHEQQQQQELAATEIEPNLFEIGSELESFHLVNGEDVEDYENSGNGNNNRTQFNVSLPKTVVTSRSSRNHSSNIRGSLDEYCYQTYNKLSEAGAAVEMKAAEQIQATAEALNHLSSNPEQQSDFSNSHTNFDINDAKQTEELLSSSIAVDLDGCSSSSRAESDPVQLQQRRWIKSVDREMINTNGVSPSYNNMENQQQPAQVTIRETEEEKQQLAHQQQNSQRSAAAAVSTAVGEWGAIEKGVRQVLSNGGSAAAASVTTANRNRR